MQRFAFFVNLFLLQRFFRRSPFQPQLLDFVNVFSGEANYSKAHRALASPFAIPCLQVQPTLIEKV